VMAMEVGQDVNDLAPDHHGMQVHSQSYLCSAFKRIRACRHSPTVP
jgi:hypothetical protein